MGNEAANFVGDGVVEKFVEGGELFDRGEAPAEEEVGKLNKVGKKGKEPTQPGVNREGLAILEEEKDE